MADGFTAVEVEHLGMNGDGAVREGNRTIFVPFAVPGDAIDPAGQVLISAGPDRVEPICRHHGNLGQSGDNDGCGGCRMQMLADPAYRAWKAGLITRALEKAGVACGHVDELHVSPPQSRRRASLAALRQGNATVFGFHERGTHRIVDLRECHVLRPELFALVAPLRALPVLQRQEGCDWVMTLTATGIDLVLERKRPPSLEDREVLAAFAEAEDIAQLSWRSGPRAEAEPIAHRRAALMRFGGVFVPFSPGGFVQATAEGEAALVAAVMDALPTSGKILDLFAGSGTFSLPAATRGPVTAIDNYPQGLAAIEKFRLSSERERPTRACATGEGLDLFKPLTPTLSRKGRGGIHSVSGIKTINRDLFSDPVEDFAGIAAAIMDPPYAGAKAQVAALAVNGPAVIAYVSCNPKTFARNAALLVAGGYSLDRITPVDQFLWSAELELIGIFVR